MERDGSNFQADLRRYARTFDPEWPNSPKRNGVFWGAGMPTSQGAGFWDILYTRTRYEKKQPCFAW